MIAVILNSGKGIRLGSLTDNCPKCMVELIDGQTIIEHQLKILKLCGIQKVIITTGYMKETLEGYVNGLQTGLNIGFVDNPQYGSTNYIKSLDYLPFIKEDILLIHGDLIFEGKVLDMVLNSETSCMIIDKTLELPEKDFKARVISGQVKAVGLDYFDESSYAAQPLYKLLNKDWTAWKEKIHEYCVNGNDRVYAENALNEITEDVYINSIDADGKLCAEIDNEEDLMKMRERMERMKL